MKNSIFNAIKWLGENATKDEKNFSIPSGITERATYRDTPINLNNRTMARVEELIVAIEKSRLDITANYQDWLHLGFALSEEFGKNGRIYFHRISQFYNGYTKEKCDTQFDHCITSNGRGITIATLFHIAQNHGIMLNKDYSNAANNVKQQNKSPNVPQSVSHLDMTDFEIPQSVYDRLPDFLKRVTSAASTNSERDLLLIGSICTLSASFYKVYGLYDKKKVYPNLYFFASAPAGTGKGILNNCRRLVKPIHDEKREHAKQLKKEYQIKELEYKNTKDKTESERPVKPPETMFFIPANNSSTGAYQLLDDNDGIGIIFETEGDTLANSFKSDYGNYSDGLRKAFHNEEISYYRRTDREYVEIQGPRISVVLSGTPKQISTLIPDAENGLFSRFIFFFMKNKIVWKNVFEKSDIQDLGAFFDTLGKEFYALYNTLEYGDETEYTLTEDQSLHFHGIFENLLNKYYDSLEEGFLGTMYRSGLIAFRISMVISTLRALESGSYTNKIICHEDDLATATEIIEVLIKHAYKTFNDLQGISKPRFSNHQKEKFLNSLPKNFDRNDYLNIAEEMNIPGKTAEGYITGYIKKRLIKREQHGLYTNLAFQEIEDSKEIKG